MKNLRLAELLFNRPLMLSEAKLNSILHVMGPRFNLDTAGMPQQEAAVLSNDERRRAGYLVQDGIAVIGVYGPLMHRRLASDFPSGGPTTYSEIRRTFDTAMTDDGVQSVVLDIDSPGGEVHGAFDLADHIFECRGIKPITAIVNESAYSAGYLLASAASRIIMPRTAGVGSVGVIASHADFSQAEAAAGIVVTHVFAGARKADWSQHQPLSSEALEILQGMVNETYGMFVETVARNRKMSIKAVRDTEAGIYEGKKAIAIGFADEINRFDKALLGLKSKGRTFVSATGKTAGISPLSKETTMDAQTLRQEHPEAVAEIESAAREGMITNQAAAEAQAAAVTAESERIMGLVTATMGEETGTRFAAVVGAGLSAEQATTLGISCAVASQASTVDQESRAAILAGIKETAPAGLKGAQPAGGEAEERQSAVSTIAQAGSR